MDEILIHNRFQMPVVTGTPSPSRRNPAAQEKTAEPESFQQVLESFQGRELTFSKHAAERIVQREIGLSQSSMDRLNEGVRIAREKGMDDALILVGKDAFIVSAKNGRVITTMQTNDMVGRAITNIDGTVIM